MRYGKSTYTAVNAYASKLACLNALGSMMALQRRIAVRMRCGHKRNDSLFNYVKFHEVFWLLHENVLLTNVVTATSSLIKK